jgi:proteasome lid subunit RPN8/RPN11
MWFHGSPVSVQTRVDIRNDRISRLLFYRCARRVEQYSADLGARETVFSLDVISRISGVGTELAQISKMTDFSPLFYPSSSPSSKVQIYGRAKQFSVWMWFHGSPVSVPTRVDIRNSRIPGSYSIVVLAAPSSTVQNSFQFGCGSTDLRCRYRLASISEMTGFQAPILSLCSPHRAVQCRIGARETVFSLDVVPQDPCRYRTRVGTELV